MAAVGSLVIDLKMELATFNTNIAKATRDINTFSSNAERRLVTMTKSIESGFSRVNRVLGAFGIALGATAVVNFGLNMLRAGGNLKELAEQLGVGTTLLQGLQYGAVQAGVSTEELEAGLRKLTQTIGDAAEGSKTAIEAFDKIGVKLLDANGALRPTDDVLRDVAEGLKGIEDPARRASIAVDLMGRGGQRLLPLLSGGAAGIDEITDAAERVGVVLTSEMIDKMDKAADSIDAHILIAKKWAQVWIAEVLPTIDQLIQRANDNPGLFGLDVGTRVLRFLSPGQGSLASTENGPPIAVITDQERAKIQEAADALEDMVNAKLELGEAKGANAAVEEIEALAKVADIASAALDKVRQELAFIQQHRPMAAAGSTSVSDLVGAVIDLDHPAGVAPSLHPGQTLTGVPAGAHTWGAGQPLGDDKGAASRIQGVIDALKLKTANLSRTNREQEIYNELAQAQVTLDSKSGQIIAGLASEYHKLALAKKAVDDMAQIHADQATQMDQDLQDSRDRAADIIKERFNVGAGIEREMQDRSALIDATIKGSHAYEVETKFLDIANRYRAIGQPLVGKEIKDAYALAEAYVNQNDKLEQMRASASYLSDFADQAFDRIGSAITQAFADGSTAAIDFGGIVKGVISEIIQALIQLTVINPLKNALFGSSLPDFASVFGGGGLTDPLPGGLQFHFAKGGYLPPGKWGTAGEEGAEMIYGGRAGMTVVPHGGGGGRGGHVFNVDMRGATVEAVQKLQAYVAHIDATLDMRALKTVVNDRQRWGTSRKAFRG